jgi:AcrR family transcriptional regulator
VTTVRRGRRPGAPDTRSAILTAARSRFAAEGYAGATIRSVAAQAGVDAALVHHYFGSKDDLFLAALQLPVDPRVLLGPVVAQGAEGAGERLLETFLAAWDDPALQPALLAVARAILDPDAGRLVTQGFLPVVIRPIGHALGLDRADDRMTLVASQVMGLILMRYLLRVEPLASMSQPDLVSTYAPVIQRFLTGPLP